ncbi:MAG: hypothetical protein SFU98_21490 [Leptospiraceae bacterium]|nr:hypothetical protein [Leptospiraceae bacterium]
MIKQIFLLIIFTVVATQIFRNTNQFNSPKLLKKLKKFEVFTSSCALQNYQKLRFSTDYVTKNRRLINKLLNNRRIMSLLRTEKENGEERKALKVKPCSSWAKSNAQNG